MQSPKVSIIVPIYNVEKYFDRCMQSLLRQTLKEIEIILVDDGSPDKCPQMCDKYARLDTRVKVIHKENAGLGFARNSGLDIAQGEYIAFVDSDDYVELNMYENLYREAVMSNADAVFAGFKTETQPGIWRDSNEVSQRTEWNGEKVKEFMLDMIACAPHVKQERKYQMSVWHSIYRSSVIQNNNLHFPSEREIVSEDIPFQIDFFKYAKKIIYIPQSYYYYCSNNTSLTKTFLIEKFERFKTLYLLLISKNDEYSYQQRSSRLFVGYIRFYLLNLVDSSQKNKLRLVEQIINDKIWNEVNNILDPNVLPLHAQIMYSLILHKHNRLVYLFAKVYSIIKKYYDKFKTRFKKISFRRSQTI